METNKIKISHFIQNIVLITGKSKAYKNKILNLSKLLSEFNDSLCVQDFTQEVTEKFVNFLRYHPNNYRQNTVYSFYHILRHILNRAGLEYIIKSGYLDVRVVREEAPTVYLTIDEIKKIIQLNTISARAKNVRDYFVIMCYTGLRLVDIRKLNPMNISNRKIIVKTQKTREIVEIPISPIVQSILDRWGNNYPKCYTQQAFHRSLRRICKIAGIDQDVVINYTQKGKLVQVKMKKYELVSPHTGRRSFATNLYLSSLQQPIPLWRIMLLTGHKSQDTFFKYIRITRDENAIFFNSHPFFE